MNDHTYDAIVVGTGISGGWAAKELTQHGLKTLVLDRGRMVKHGEYPTAMMNPWEIPHRNRPTQEDLQRQPVLARTGYANAQVSKHWFVDETEDPYIEIQRFDWIRGYHVGGRSIMWGRQSYRWSDLDFEANARDGIAVDWPIRYKDISPWYDHVEKFIGVSGNNDHLSQLPDGQVPAGDGTQLRGEGIPRQGERQVRSRADHRPRRAHDRSAHAQRKSRSAAPAARATCAFAVVRSARISAAYRARCRRPRKPAT